MTEFGTRAVNRKTAIKLAARKVGRLINIDDHSSTLGFIGFTEREMKRRDVTLLIGGQPTQQICPMGNPFWFQAHLVSHRRRDRRCGMARLLRPFFNIAEQVVIEPHE